MSQIKRNGFALFQVLLMVSIMSILILLLVQYANRSIQIATEIQTSAEKRLALRSFQHLLEFELATKPWTGSDSLLAAYGLNFHGVTVVTETPQHRAFSALNRDVRVTLQNMRSLIDLRFVERDVFIALAASQGISDDRARELFRALETWQLRWSLANRSGVVAQQSSFLELSSVAELRSIPGWTEAEISRLAPFFTVHGREFNPYFAPQPLLNALLPSSQTDIVARWREQNPNAILSASTLPSLAGVSLQDAAPRRTVTIRIETEGFVVERLVEVRPTYRVPLRRIQDFY